MAGIPHSPWVAPCEANRPGAGALHSELLADPEKLTALIERFERDELQNRDVERIGRYLFDCLLGQELWDAIVADATADGVEVLELALVWDADDYGLHRLSWETMHDGASFLSVHPRLAVAVVRVVANAEAVGPKAHPAPARMLFAVGADLNDPDIRPGAEVIGLLRGVERDGYPIESTIVDSITPSALAKACGKFKPQIVHLVSHGRLDATGRGEIRLQRDEIEESGWVNAERLMRAFAAGDELPSLVLLTGCESAAAGEHMDSLAAELVKRGIPTVIGMAGEIIDPVCRLFSRSFVLALSNGERLVEAMTHGRRAGLLQQQMDPADDHAWALPSIYMAPCVPARHAPIDASGTAAIVRRIGGYGLSNKPVFCGRQRFGQLFDRLLDERDELEVLIAYTEAAGKLGKTRLLYELAGRALWAGHVVVMIDDDFGDPNVLPSTSVQLGAWLLEKICETRAIFLGNDAEWFESEILRRLVAALDGPRDLARLPPAQRRVELREFLGEAKDSREAEDALAVSLGQALIEDLRRLMTDARGAEADAVGPGSLPVLVLGGLGNWDKAAEVLRQMLGPRGLGSGEFSVPVFATCCLEDAAGEVLRNDQDDASRRPWVRYEELKPFEDHEDTLAYQWVLLHPWSPYRYGDTAYVSDRFHPDAKVWEELFKEKFEGVPGCFNTPDFYELAHFLHRTKHFVSADDESILAAYAERA